MERIQYQNIKVADAVETFFAAKFEKLETHSMDEESTKFMMSLIFANIPEDDKKINEMFLAQVIEKRFKALGYTLDIKTKLFLAYMTQSPGKAVMYCHYLAYFCKKRNLTHLTFDDFCEKAFPWGFPSDKDLNKLWDAQKIHIPTGEAGPDNLLDYFGASQSIMNIKEEETKENSDVK